MHSSTEELLTYLERNRAALRDAVDSVPESQRRTRPAADRWSAAEVLEHLAIVERRVAARLADALAAAKTGAEPPARLDGDAPMDQRFARILRNRTRRISASQASEPTGQFDVETAWSSLEEARQSTVQLIHESDGLALAERVAPHPIFGELTFRQWVVFLGGHDERHTDQIREIASAFNA